jgi:HlyD family secretion protein
MPGHLPTMGELAASWRGGRRRWVLLIAAVLVIALIVFGIVHALTADAGTKPVKTVTVAADTGVVTTQVATTGTLQPAQTRSLSFAVSGTVESVSVAAGATVGAGQTLAKVDSTDAAATVDSAQEALDQAETALTQAQDNAAKPTTAPAGCNVPAAYVSPRPSVSPTVTASPTPHPTTTASPTRSRGATPARTTPPAAGGGKTGKTSCTTTGSRSGSGSGSGSGSASQQGQGTSSGGTDAIYSAEQRLNQAQVTLDNAEDALDGATITAPIAGKILSVSGKVGSQVNQGSAFITLADVYNMQISADFPEADADHLAIKQAATATLASQPGKTFKATVVQVDPTGTSDGTLVRYGVLLSFVDAPKDLLVGQSANVVVTTGSVADTLRVPSTAVHDVAGTSGTVLKSAGGTTSQVKVGLGLIGDQYTQITSGLAAGDVVVRSW